MLKTIREVFVHNLRVLRADRTQAQIAEMAEIPLRSYQRAEGGDIPQDENLIAIAGALGVSMTRLFLDSDLTDPQPEQALEVLRKTIARVSVLRAPQKELLELLPSIDDDQAIRLVNLVKKRQSILGRNHTPPKKGD